MWLKVYGSSKSTAAELHDIIFCNSIKMEGFRKDMCSFSVAYTFETNQKAL